MGFLGLVEVRLFFLEGYIASITLRDIDINLVLTLTGVLKILGSVDKIMEVIRYFFIIV